MLLYRTNQINLRQVRVDPRLPGEKPTVGPARSQRIWNADLTADPHAFALLIARCSNRSPDAALAAVQSTEPS